MNTSTVGNKPIRWWQRIYNLVRTLVQGGFDILGSFLGVETNDGVGEVGAKATRAVLKRAAYFAADYYLVAMSIGLVAFLKHRGFTFWWIFVAMWAFDFIVASAFILYYHGTGVDITWGEELRRAVDSARAKSRILGLFSATAVFFVAIVWNGPERIVIYLRKEINTILGIAILLVILTSVQAALWTYLYSKGYDALVH